MTYSIVARDAATGQLGLAAQSHAFGVGRMLNHVQGGVGAVASQAMSLYEHGTRVLADLAGGETTGEALDRSLALDASSPHRQVTAISATGETAAHTGADCLRFAGHHQGGDFVVAGNILVDEDVLAAMVAAAEQPHPSLARRMLAVLEAAEESGGDMRGRQSATMIVARAETTGEPLMDRPVDIRVDDHPDPLPELARLLDVAEAHAAMEIAEHAVLDGDLDTARQVYAATLPRMGDNLEFHVWTAATMASAGHADDAADLIATLADAPDRDRWEDLCRRLAERGYVDPAIVDDWWT
ncbi:MAG TPA: DUF1028 domain-containing protein [Nitriliruptoraceae bacterium]|nr:DUF1028 domain-containing protein [Nitriliruptoraceae bacterium]